jgi:uncharacterized protein
VAYAEPVREWVGGRLTLPARIESMGDRRAEMALWVELPDLQVVGQVLEDPQDPQASFGQSLMRAMASPLVGEPRRPQRVRVADAALAEQLKSFSFLSVEVAPTPEFDRVVRALGAFFGEGSYFSDPSLTPKDVEKFFVGARFLWAARPWTLAAADALVHVEVPAMGIKEGCVSIVGSLEEVRGFVFFPSYEDYERMTESAGNVKPGEPLASHRALYFSFDAKEDVPEGMRKEVAEHGWQLADENAYPILLRMVDGKHAPVLEHELKLATAVMRAIGAFAIRHPQALQNYGDVKIRESQFDENDLEVILSVPHPLSDQALESEIPPRAMTLDSTPNPYGLPLESPKLKQLVRALGEFTLHRVLGLFCAVASVPELPRPSVWLGEIMQHVKFADEAQARGIMELLMVVYSHVISTIERDGVDALIPEAADVDACREWARGYTALLGRIDPAQIEERLLDSAFAIQALAEIPQMIKLLDELRGDKTREAMLADYRESLADDADCLLEGWAEARAKPSRPPEATFRREMPKVGRNDPCPCGSGKKYKKCCATN